MWEPQPLTTLWAFTAVTGIALPFTFYHRIISRPWRDTYRNVVEKPAFDARHTFPQVFRFAR
jgi:hypothetical protein